MGHRDEEASNTSTQGRQKECPHESVRGRQKKCSQNPQNKGNAELCFSVSGGAGETREGTPSTTDMHRDALDDPVDTGGPDPVGVLQGTADIWVSAGEIDPSRLEPVACSFVFCGQVRLVTEMGLAQNGRDIHFLMDHFAGIDRLPYGCRSQPLGRVTSRHPSIGSEHPNRRQTK